MSPTPVPFPGLLSAGASSWLDLHRVDPGYLSIGRALLAGGTDLRIDDPSLLSDPRDLAGFVGAFRRRMAADFEQEQTVVLDGWILSRTEATLCALVALHHDGLLPLATREAGATPFPPPSPKPAS